MVDYELTRDTLDSLYLEPYTNMDITNTAIIVLIERRSCSENIFGTSVDRDITFQ